MVSLYVLLIARLQSGLAFAAVSAAAAIRSVLGAVLGIAAALVSGRAAIAILGLALGYAAGELMGRWVAVGRGSDGQITVAGPTITPGAAIEMGAAKGQGGAIDAVEPPLERATYGVASAGAAVASYALSVGDRFLLGASRPLAELGTYAATYSMIDLVGRFIPSVVLGAMRPRLFRAWDLGARTELGSAAIILAAILGWIVVVMASLLIAAAEMTGRLPVDLVLAGPIAFGFACFMAANTLGLAYSAATRQPRLAAHLGIAAVVNIGLNLVLIPPFGPEGAAVTTAASYLLLLILNGSSLGGSPRIGASVIAVAASGLAAIGCLVLAGAVTSPSLIVVSFAILAIGAPFVLRCGRTLRELG
jgi:O-antigen/teichoic acid export membrane protein